MLSPVSSLITVSLLVFSLWIAAGFELLMKPELSSNQSALSSSLASRFERGVRLDIPPNQMVGVDALLEGAIAAAQEIKFLAVVDHRGCVLYWAGVGRNEVEVVVARFSQVARSGPAFVADCGRSVADERLREVTATAGELMGERRMSPRTSSPLRQSKMATWLSGGLIGYR